MSSSTDMLIGTQIDEYRIEQLLGTGGMARVYRALDTRLLRYVALKVIAPNFRADQSYTARFEREAQSIARLEHPNIVRIYRFGEVNGLYYIAMQYVEGADISWLVHEYKANNEVMPINDTVHVIEDMGTALDYAHTRGVIHRDVKPGNMIINTQGRAILTDFGLALLGDAAAQAGELMGSPHYIAPEQASANGIVVPQTDFYGLGITLYEMLTGELPFTGGDPATIASRHVTETPPLPSQFDPSISPAVDNVVMRCLEKDPRERYLTGAALAADFRQAVAIWQNANNPAPDLAAPWDGQTNRHPSIINIPDKVSQRIAAAPLPAVPSTPPAPAAAPPSLPSFMLPRREPARDPQSVQAARPVPTIPANQNPRYVPDPVVPQGGYSAQPDYSTGYGTRFLGRSGAWKLPAIIGAGFLIVALLACLFFFALAARTLFARPVAAPTARPIVTLTSRATNTSIAPTFEVPVIPTGQFATIPAQFPTVPPASTQVLLPPTDRNFVPPNSRRLGEFTVEWYCNQRSLGVIITNNQSDWACTNQGDNSIVFILSVSDYDNICRTRYNDPGAFAIRDQHKDIQAYNWSCYEYLPTTG